MKPEFKIIIIEIILIFSQINGKKQHHLLKGGSTHTKVDSDKILYIKFCYFCDKKPFAEYLKCILFKYIISIGDERVLSQH